jgi:putative transposase
MTFETGDLYHIYNQGNDRVRIFFTRANYIFFLDKIKNHIQPYADVLAWCLMPNHFHLMVYVHTLEISSCKVLVDSLKSNPADLNDLLTHKTTINKSIGILESSYTRAINIQEDRSGSLFRIHTHAECLTKIDLHTPPFFNTSDGTLINQHFAEKEYPQVCFNYIHNNPVKSGLVKHPLDWEFSSYRDYCGLRNGQLINRKRAEEFGLSIFPV